MSNLKVVPIGTPNLKEVPNNLRALADRLESGDYQQAAAAIAIVIGEDGDMRIYGYGERMSPLEMQGWMAMAQTHHALASRAVTAPLDER